MNDNKYDNSFRLFVNDQKRPGSKQPDMGGDGTIDGVKIRLAGWKRESNKGGYWISGKFETEAEYNERMQSSQRGGRQGSGGDSRSYGGARNDDIPF